MKRLALLTPLAALAFAAACSDDTPTRVAEPPPGSGPLFSASDPSNGAGQCMGQDAVTYNWLVSGVKATDDPATVLNCTANDVAVAEAVAYEATVPDPADPTKTITVDPRTTTVTCKKGDLITLKLKLALKQNASSERQDIGLWVDRSGGSALVAPQSMPDACNHYNIPNGTPGTSNADGDQCAGMASGGSAELDIGTITLTCQDVNNDQKLDVGNCTSWKVPSDDQECPNNADGVGAPGQPTDFRAGTLMSNKSKCNCSRFPVNITVVETGSLTIIKDAVPNDPQDFAFTTTGAGLSSFSLDDDDDPTLSNTKTFTNLLTGGTRTVTEQPVSGWTLTNIVCTANGATVKIGRIVNGVFANGGGDGFDAGDNTVQVGVAGSSAPACTFTNTKHGSLTIIKDAVPDDPQDFAFTTSGDGISGFSLDDDDDPTLSNTKKFADLLPGLRTVAETTVRGWTLTNIVCTGATNSTVKIGSDNKFDAGDNSVSVDLAAGEDVSCTFTNTATASLAIQKKTDGGTGTFQFAGSGDGLPSSFSRNTATANPTTEAAFTLTGTQLGTKYVQETVPAGWALTGIACTSSGATIVIGRGTGASFENGGSDGFDAGDNSVKVTLAPGNAPSCTFTNTKLGTIVIEKITAGGAGGPFGFTTNGAGLSAFSLTTSGAGAAGKASQTFSNLTPGSYSVTEGSLPSNWALTDLTCTTGGTTSGSTANITLAAGQTVTCTYTNTSTFLPGRMTGGTGNIQLATPSEFISAGFTLHCDVTLSNNFEINWKSKGAGQKWHITKPLVQPLCTLDPKYNAGKPDAPFNKMTGTAQGLLNGTTPSLLVFTLIDNGEPGKNNGDWVQITVYNGLTTSSGVAFETGGLVQIKGNIQAHYDQPHK